jgi:zinc transporter 1/2/3
MFKNPCLAQSGTILKYEATTTSIMMGGAFVAFLVDFVGHRIGHWRRDSVAKRHQPPSITSNETPNGEVSKTGESGPTVSNLAALGHHHPHPVAGHANDSLSVIILEVGIIFHSILIGITLVVAGDTVFITLFIVIVFHQMFEGLALGARIASIEGLPRTKYIVLPLLFAFITPIGMAIGIGLINNFNGNDPSTILALGTLDAVSAGILTWVGFVSMWANDWIYGELTHAPLIKTGIALFSLMAGMALMGLLGKWA